MTFSGLPRVKRHWHLNLVLLSDKDFVKFMEEQITLFFLTNNSPETSSLSVWDALKAYLRGKMISYTANIKKRPHEEQLEITNQIKDIDRRYSQARHPELYKERVELQTKFDLFLTTVLFLQANLFADRRCENPD